MPIERFSQVDCCLAQYEIPKDEAFFGGYKHYLQSMDSECDEIESLDWELIKCQGLRGL